MFTIFEMAPGEGGGLTAADLGVEDFNFNDDFSGGGADYGADEDVLDLSDAYAAGYGSADATEATASLDTLDDLDFDTGSAAAGLTSHADDIGPSDFELDLSEATGDPMLASNDIPPVATEEIDLDTPVPDLSPEPEPDLAPEPEVSPEAEEAPTDNFDDFGGGFDSEVEGLGFGFDEAPAAEDNNIEMMSEPEAEIDLDEAPEPEAEIALDEAPEPESEIALEESPEFDAELSLDEAPEAEVSMEPDMDFEADTLDDFSAELPEEPAEEAVLDEPEAEEEGGIDFSLDMDEDFAAAPEEPESEPEPAFDGDTDLEMDGLTLEMEPSEEPEEEEENP
ncbi:MAG: hypothetical protein GWN10_12070 [Nitrospinaceae bacterium]|nr:hypothetical protein [Nitrospinaceae bacterium]NIS85793.1 hypothetical protein [Nitrospinaceae bacterium]NIT82643.1 hypothetical protein [Nitrospinaceae bacterium]NIU44848.1 hypothetical protein [Nitrospinaceae bacterium]NIU97016.1 hypothetical protein [Nitrospinaceae bacterium]